MAIWTMLVPYRDDVTADKKKSSFFIDSNIPTESLLIAQAEIYNQFTSDTHHQYSMRSR